MSTHNVYYDKYRYQKSGLTWNQQSVGSANPVGSAQRAANLFYERLFFFVCTVGVDEIASCCDQRFAQIGTQRLLCLYRQRRAAARDLQPGTIGSEIDR